MPFGNGDFRVTVARPLLDVSGDPLGQSSVPGSINSLKRLGRDGYAKAIMFLSPQQTGRNTRMYCLVPYSPSLM